MKNQTEAPAEKLMVNKVLEKPWIYWTADFIIKLLLVAKKNEIWVVCDRLLKMAHLVATTKETLYYDNY